MSRALRTLCFKLAGRSGRMKFIKHITGDQGVCFPPV